MISITLSLQIRHSYRHFLALLAVICLSGCGTSTIKIAPPYSMETPLNENQGFVVARVVNAGSIIAPINQITIAPKNLNASDKVVPTRLLTNAAFPGETTLFASAVDSGEYSVSSLRSFYSGYERRYDRFVDTGIELGTFRVQPGKITDLGTLIYYSKPDGDIYKDLVLRSPTEPDNSLIEMAFPDLKYSDNDLLTWIDDGHSEERQVLYGSVVQSPTRFSRQYQAPDGALYFIGKLGFVIKRNANGVWEQDAVDTDFDLKAIAVNSNGDVLVGGEFGNLFLKYKGAEWKKIPIAENFWIEEIIFKSDNLVDVVLLNSDKLEIRRANLLKAEESWPILASHTIYDSCKSTQNKAFEMQNATTYTNCSTKLLETAKFMKIDGSKYLNIVSQGGSEYSIFNGSNSVYFSLDQETWSISKADNGNRKVDYIYNAGALDFGIDKPGVLSFDQNIKYLIYSTSQKKWRNVSTKVDRCPGLRKEALKCKKVGDNKAYKRHQEFRFASIPYFFSNTEGIAFVYYDRYEEEPIQKILVTENSGKTWTETEIELPDKYCNETVPEADKVFLVGCNGVSGDFYESTDKGKTWLHVREHVHF